MNRKHRFAAAKKRGQNSRQIRRLASTDSKLKESVSCYRAGRLSEATRLCTEILSQEPKKVAALHLLGLIKFQEGDALQAAELINRVIALRPDDAEAYNNLGNAFNSQGKLEEAVAAYLRALELKPGYAEAHNNLGIAFKNQGKLEEAVAAYHKALEIKPADAKAHVNLGVALKDQGKLEEAVTAYLKALELNPNIAEAHNNLGIALKDQGKLEEAVTAYRKALALRPDGVEAHNNLGAALQNLGKLDEAVASFRKALELRPDGVEAHNNLGAALQNLGKLDEAIASFRKALAIKPDSAESHSNLADVLEKTNRIETLREAVAVAKQNCPNHPRLSLGEALLLKRDGDFVAARVILEVTGKRVANAAFQNKRAYLLGEINDRLGDTEAAYSYFTEGNRRTRDMPTANLVDEKSLLARIEVLERCFTSDWVAGWRSLKSSDGPSNLVFLVGFPRSGTTLLNTILRSHGAISVVEEIPTVFLLRKAFERLPGGYPNGLADLIPTHLEEVRQVYFAELGKHLAPEGRSAIVVDKLPLNIVEAGLIHRIFPQARFLFAQRHPCDCVLSCFMQAFDINEAMINFLDLEDAARLYDKVMTLWQEYQAILPLKVHTVRYEGLIEDFEETLTPLLDFLGVEWDDSVRNYTETAIRRDKIRTPSYYQVTQPLYTRARGRWKRYSKFMQPVLPILLPWARRFDYGE